VEKYKRLIKYIIFGGTSALLELIFFLLLSRVLPVYAAAFVSFLIGLIASFFFNKVLVFKKAGGARSEAWKFLLLGLVNSQLSPLLTLLLSQVMDSSIAKVITMACIAVWNYLLMKYVIFKER